MDRHPFDPISLVFGLVFLAAGLIAVFDGSIVDDGAFLLPLGLIGLGLAVVLQNQLRQQSGRKGGPSDEIGPEGSEDG
jgi:small-conductance mechanosensitive channel